MESGNKKIDVVKGNLDRDTQIKMYEQKPLSGWAVVS